MEGYIHLTPDEFRNFPLSDVIHDKEGLRFMKKGVNLLDYSYAFGVIVQVEALGEIEMSDWTYEDWMSSPARKIMITLMNSKDKQNKWNNLSLCDKEEIKSLPNFDSEIFFRTTGIKVD